MNEVGRNLGMRLEGASGSYAGSITLVERWGHTPYLWFPVAKIGHINSVTMYTSCSHCIPSGNQWISIGLRSSEMLTLHTLVTCKLERERGRGREWKREREREEERRREDGRVKFRGREQGWILAAFQGHSHHQLSQYAKMKREGLGA